MSDLTNAARDRAIDKIRKLLAVARDGRGNEHEAAAAASQAEKMMRHYQIECADIVLEELTKEESFDRGLEPVTFEGKAGYNPKSHALWVGVIAVGVGRAFTVKVDIVMTSIGVMARFSGYRPDVELARWVYRLLCETVYRLSRETTQGQGMSAAKAFRYGAASALQIRLYAMAAERDDDNALTSGTAIALYDQKAKRVKEMFGETNANEKKTSLSSNAAYWKGQRAGDRMNIPAGRPVSGGTQNPRLN